MKIGIVTNAAFSLPILQLLLNNKIQASVFSDACFSDQTDMPAIKHFCSLANTPVHCAAPDDLYLWLQEVKPHAVFIIGYRHLVKLNNIDATLQPHVYNVHFGPLPSYKGANPVFWQIRNGETSLTASIHRINERFDDGPLIWSKSIKREIHINYGVAHTMLSYASAEGVVYILQHLLQKKTLAALPVDNSTRKYYKRPAIDDVSVKWDTMTADQIIDLMLACNPWNKGAATSYNNQEIKLIDAWADTHTAAMQYHPGTILECASEIVIACKDNTLLRLTMLNIDGTFVPARHAAFYGIAAGSHFSG